MATAAKPKFRDYYNAVNVPLVDTGWRVGMPHGINRPMCEPVQVHEQAVLGRLEENDGMSPRRVYKANPELMRRWHFAQVSGYGVFGK